MIELKLNIYKNQKEIEKTLVASGYDLMLGTCEDIMDILDIDQIDDTKEFAAKVVRGYKQLKPLLKDIFEDLTDEDLRGIKVKELIPLALDICKNVGETMGLLSTGE